MKIAICCGEQDQTDILKGMLDEYFYPKHIEYYLSVFSDGAELITAPERLETEFDIIFIEHRENGINGIETSRKIRITNTDCAIIFISAHIEAAVEAFEVDAYRFLLKPISAEKLFEALDSLHKKTNRGDNLIIKTRVETISIKMSEIVFCEADGRHSFIHTQNGTIKVLKNIKEIERRLPASDFFRCHKAYIAAFSHISSFTGGQIVFDNNECAFISRNYLSSFKSAFNEYILKHNKLNRNNF